MLSNTAEDVFLCVWKQTVHFQEVFLTTQQENALKYARQHQITFLITQLEDVYFTVLRIL